MYPMLRDNDYVVVRKLPSQRLKKGCLVVFKDKEGRLIVHRMIGKKGKSLCLKGDGHNLNEEIIDKRCVKGKAVGIIRDGRYIGLTRFWELYFWIVSFPRKHFIGIRKKLKNGT